MNQLFLSLKKDLAMSKKIILLNFLLSNLIFNLSLAFCPVCTVVVAGGVGLSRWLKVDDLISGLWIGGLLVSLSLWTINWLNKKNIKFLFRKILIFVFWYGITILPLYKAGIIGDLRNQIFGIDKLIGGIILGSLVFVLSLLFNNFLIKRNNNKVYFPFQKVAIPVLFLLISSLILYFLIK
jgi:cation transport ATPase